MKKIFSILSFLSVVNFASAQSFTIQTDTVTTSGILSDATADTVYYTMQLTTHLQNNIPTIVPSFWVRDIQYLTTGWTTSCCDPVNCHDDTTNSSTFDFPANQNALVVVDFKPHGHEGMGVVKVKYAPSGNMTDSTSGYFIGTLAIGVGIVKTEMLKDIKLFPNPATENLMIATTDEMLPSNIEVFDLLGKKMNLLVQKKGANLFSVNVNDLKDGFYFIQMNLKNGSVTTRRFTKN